MDTVLNILASSGVGLLGIVFFTLWRAKKYFLKTAEEFSIAKLINENLGAWTWALLIIILVAILTVTLPETANSIASFTGLDLAANKAGFFTFGLGLIALTKQKNDR